MRFDSERIRRNVRDTDTEDLLDRVTAYRAGLEPEAIAIIEEELHQRGIGPGEIEDHRRASAESCLENADGTLASCSFCRHPAIAERWGWFRLWRKVPLFPWKYRYCSEHLPK